MSEYFDSYVLMRVISILTILTSFYLIIFGLS